MTSRLTIALVMLVLAIATASIAIYEVETAPVGCLGCGEQSLHVPPYLVTGTLSVSPSSNISNLTVVVRNSYPNSSIISVTLVDECPNDCPNGTGTIPNVADLVVSYLGNPVSRNNPLPAGPAASGTLEASKVTVGVMYTVNVRATFADGYEQVQTLLVIAQSSA